MVRVKNYETASTLLKLFRENYWLLQEMRRFPLCSKESLMAVKDISVISEFNVKKVVLKI